VALAVADDRHRRLRGQIDQARDRAGGEQHWRSQRREQRARVAGIVPADLDDLARSLRLARSKASVTHAQLG